MYTDEFMEALALLYLHPADFCPLATRKSYICTRLVSLLVALDCNGHFEAVLESEGVMCWILWDCFGTLSLLSLAIQKLAQQKGAKRSVLTRILPWGVLGPPLLRNRGPVRTLAGQSYKKHAVRRTWARTPNCLLHEVPTWSNMAEEVFTIRRRSLRCSGTCVGPMKVKATKLKTLTHLISCFLFVQTNRML